MQLERTPQPGQIWQHFKGNDYKIILVTGIEATTNSLFSLVDITIIHSELNREVLLCEYENRLALTTDLINDYISCDQIISNHHVIYQRVDPEFPQVWARPLDNFLEIIEEVVSNNYARFNRIG